MSAPVNYNLLQRVRQALYSLKKEYGAPVDIYKLISSETDARTGEKNITKQVYSVRRAIVLPSQIKRLANQSISLISFNKEFVTGGLYDVSARDFIIDRRDVPALPELTQDDWLVYGGHKYQILSIQEFEPDAGWIIVGRRLVGEVPEQLINAQADHVLEFQSVATAVVE